ncbi:hypothetical protein SCARD494_01764 [Seiridium cardinale]
MKTFTTSSRLSTVALEQLYHHTSIGGDSRLLLFIICTVRIPCTLNIRNLSTSSLDTYADTVDLIQAIFVCTPPRKNEDENEAKNEAKLWLRLGRMQYHVPHDDVSSISSSKQDAHFDYVKTADLVTIATRFICAVSGDTGKFRVPGSWRYEFGVGTACLDSLAGSQAQYGNVLQYSLPVPSPAAPPSSCVAFLGSPSWHGFMSSPSETRESPTPRRSRSLGLLAFGRAKSQGPR